jgi:SAM-dependent methyltransferase
MADRDRKKWDIRYAKDLGSTEPSSILTQYWPLASVGKALDIACGNGRNSVFLAERGFAVDAVDISIVATDQLEGKHPNINVICVDLDTWEIPLNRYQLIVNIRFLDRRLFPLIRDGLRFGGIVIFESFLDGETDIYCLKQEELIRAFESLNIVYYKEKKIDPAGKFDRIASLVARK